MIGSSVGMLLTVRSNLAGVNREQRHILCWWRLEKGGAPLVPVEHLAFSGLGGFKISAVDFSTDGLRGLSTFGDSPPSGMFFACKAKGIS
jgi:hypothetical protein